MNSEYSSIPPEERLRRIVILNLIRRIQKNFRVMILMKNSTRNKYSKNSQKQLHINQNFDDDNMKGHSYQNTQEKGKLIELTETTLIYLNF